MIRGRRGRLTAEPDLGRRRLQIPIENKGKEKVTHKDIP